MGNKSREFYEFVLPAIDMHLTDKNLKVIIDIPGFSKKDKETLGSAKYENGVLVLVIPVTKKSKNILIE